MTHRGGPVKLARNKILVSGHISLLLRAPDEIGGGFELYQEFLKRAARLATKADMPSF